MSERLDGLQLDDWQRELSDQAVEMIFGLPSKQVRHLINAPTGGGKTEIGIDIVQRVLDQWPERYSDRRRNPITCAWLSERAILQDETAERLERAGLRTRNHCDKPQDQRMLIPGVVNMIRPQVFVERNKSGFEAEIVGNGGEIDPFADVNDLQIVTSQKTVKHKKGYRPLAYERTIGEWGVLIADEAHHSAADFYGSCIRAWPGPVVGLTATSWLLSDKMGLGEGTSVPNANGSARLSGPFLTISYGPGPRELVGKRLSEIEFAEIDRRLTIKEYNLETTDLSADGYTPKSVDKEVSRMLAVGMPIVREWERLAKRPCLWFCRSKAAAREVARLFKAAGYTSGVVLAETPEEERRELLDALAAGSLMCLASVDVFGEGVNVPSINTVAMLRPTCSLTKHLQFLGRGLRNRPDGSPLLVLDFADNVSRLGSPLSYRNEKEFGLLPRDQYPSTGGYGGAKCPDCSYPCIWSQHHCHNPNCRRPLSWICEGQTITINHPFERGRKLELEVPGHQVREWCGRYLGKEPTRTACDRAIEEATRAWIYAHQEEEEAKRKAIEEAERERLAEENKLKELAEARERRRKNIQRKWAERKALLRQQRQFLNASSDVTFSPDDIKWIRVPNPTETILWVPLSAASTNGQEPPYKMIAMLQANGKFRVRMARAPLSQTLEGMEVDPIEFGSYTISELEALAAEKLHQWGLKRGRILKRINTHKYGDGTDAERNTAHVDFSSIR